MIEGFLAENRLHPGSFDLRACCDAFREEMTRGLDGQPSSLPMIPTYIETSRAVPRGQRVIALDAGGTNMRAALVSFSDAGLPVVEGMARHRMPGVDAALTKEQFFRALADAVRPHLNGTDRIGFCFSYPAEITPQKDGPAHPVHQGDQGDAAWTGSSWAQAWRTRSPTAQRQPVARIILLNDTVATLLAGRNALAGRRFDDFIGLVCGTGLNAAYVERNALIRKIPGLDPGRLAGGEHRVRVVCPGRTGPVDDAFDATMANPGKYRNEKCISGAYLGALCLFAAKSAATAGCLSVAGGAAAGRAGALDARAQ